MESPGLQVLHWVSLAFFAVSVAAMIAHFVTLGRPGRWRTGYLWLSAVLLAVHLICLPIVWPSLVRGDKSFFGLAYYQHRALVDAFQMTWIPLLLLQQWTDIAPRNKRFSYAVLIGMMIMGLAISLAKPEMPPHVGWR